MTDWTSGYIADIDYSYGYYAELDPSRARLALLNAGLVPPSLGCHCELGFGQGLSVNIHAAASGNVWYATDFNPSQAGFAQELAKASAANTHLYDQAFAEFCARDDLPDFDSIGLHGIWSWISDENRSIIVDFIRRKLKAGGVLYVSYNCLPGWATTIPLRDLLHQHAETLGAKGAGIVSRVDAALAFADKLMAVSPAYLLANPQITERLKQMRGHDRHYLAHEYFNDHWQPISFAQMNEWLASAKLTFACSANYLEHIDTINLTTEQQQLLKDIPDSVFRQTVRDFCLNRQFRRDYWIKGARKLNRVEKSEVLRAQQVVLARSRESVPKKVTANLGEITLQDAVYVPILDLLADYRPRTLADIERALAGKLHFKQIIEAVMILTGTGWVMAAQDEIMIEAVTPASDRLNACLINRARGSDGISYLASPVTGCGIMVGRSHQLFLLARASGNAQPAQWAEFVWQIATSQGQGVIKDGKALQSADESLAELTTQAEAFARQQLPVLQALRIAK